MANKDDNKRRITKTEKIAELQGQLKILRDENRRLQQESNGTNSEGLGNSSHHVSTKERDKLKEALKTLKRVTVKQEVSLATLRQKSKLLSTAFIILQHTAMMGQNNKQSHPELT